MKSFACLSVIECKLVGKRAMGTSILPRCLYKWGVLFDVPRFEEVSSQVFPHISCEHTSIRQSFTSAETRDQEKNQQLPQKYLCRRAAWHNVKVNQTVSNKKNTCRFS